MSVGRPASDGTNARAAAGAHTHRIMLAATQTPLASRVALRGTAVSARARACPVSVKTAAMAGFYDLTAKVR